LCYHDDVFDSRSSLDILGFAFSIAGAIAGGYALIEKLFGLSLFSLFWKITPAVMQSSSPTMTFTPWFSIRAQRNIHEAWDVALFYFVLLSIIIPVMAGCWVFLILAILGIYNIGIFWLAIWFVSLFFLYLVSASTQVAVEIKARHPRANVERILRYMQEEPIITIKRWFYFLFRNWLIAPLTGLKLLFILFFLLLLDGPAWLTMLLPRGPRLDLSNDDVRKYYYIGYSVFFIVTGLILMFV